MEFHPGNKVIVVRGRPNPYFSPGAMGYVVGVMAGGRTIKVQFTDGTFQPHNPPPINYWYVNTDNVDLVEDEPATQEQVP